MTIHDPADLRPARHSLPRKGMTSAQLTRGWDATWVCR